MAWAEGVEATSRVVVARVDEKLKETRMFKIRSIHQPDLGFQVVEEREDRFIGQSSCGSYVGQLIYTEFLKTHWTRAEEWQDVTKELGISASAKILGPPGQTHNNPIAIIQSDDYRFVKVEKYVYGTEWPTTFLRVERKEDHV